VSFARISRAASLSLLCGSILSGCVGDTSTSRSRQKPNLREAQKFDAYPIYYAGDEVAGLPFEGDGGGDWPASQAWRRWTFFYGDCEPHPRGGPFEGTSCSPPLEIQNWSACDRGAGGLHRKLHLFDFHGAKATGGTGGSRLEIFTGRTTVVIFARGQNIARAAARRLRDVRPSHRSSRLPPPDPGALGGNCPAGSYPTRR